jgi:UDP-glucose 4-epimerase
MVGKLLQVALGQRESISIFGDDYPTTDGTCVRDYVHVDDLATAHLAALRRLDQQCFELNLGTGRGASVRDVIEACRRVTKHEIPTTMGERRPGDPPELVANSTLAQKLLDWQPRYTDVESIIETAWRWHSTHPGGYATQA